MIIALGGVFVDAYDFTSLGIGAIQLRHEFHLTATEVGALSSTMAFSALFGALVGGYFVDKLGRKRMFLLDLWFFVFSAIGAALAPNLAVLLAFRLLMGLGVGLDFPVAMSFVAEFSNRANRGRFVNLSYLNWYLAAIVGFIASWIGYVLGANVENLTLSGTADLSGMADVGGVVEHAHGCTTALTLAGSSSPARSARSVSSSG
jgi:MFS family permease